MCGNGQIESQPPVPVSTQQDNQQPPENGSEQPNKNKNSGESFKSPLPQQVPQPHNQETHPNRKQNHQWYDYFLAHPTDWLIAIFSGLLAFFTWRLWVSTNRLWKASQEQSKGMLDSINQADRSATAMEKVARSMQISTNAAVENVAIFKDVRENQLRPWVLVGDVVINNVMNPSKFITIKIPEYKPTGAHIINPKIGPIATIYIKNSGPTPAINLTHWGSICIKEYPLKSALPEKRSDMAITKATIASQGVNTLTVHWPDPLTPEQITALENGTMVVYVHGEIIYKDIFSKNRTTRYRVMHGAMTGLLGATTGVTICEDGNEVD